MATPEKKVKEYLTLSELENNKMLSSVHVLNVTKPSGIIDLQITEGMGNKVVIRVPVTWIPYDLTTRATKASILASPEFRKLIVKQMITLPTPEKVDEILARPGAQEEVRRAYDVEQSTDLLSDSSNAEVQALLNEDDASGFVMNLVMRDDLDEDSVLNALMGQESSLTEIDLKHVVQNSKFPKVKSYAAQRLSA